MNFKTNFANAYQVIKAMTQLSCTGVAPLVPSVCRTVQVSASLCSQALERANAPVDFEGQSWNCNRGSSLGKH